jgi:Fe-S cluster assembly scaffold protein SufB
MSDFELLLKLYELANIDTSQIKNLKVSHLVVHKNKVVGSHFVDGLVVEPKETSTGVEINFRVLKGVKIENPVHLCFGVLPEEGLQEIKINAKIEDGAKIKILSHCTFPNAKKVVHKMDAVVEIGDDAYYEYEEVHTHSDYGGIEVIPKAKVYVGKNSQYITHFTLIKGRVGIFDLDYEVHVKDYSSLVMDAKIYGLKEDKIKLREAGFLEGVSSKGLIKSRVAVRDKAISEIISEITASAKDARGHVDCTEIIQGEAQAKAIPIVNVLNEFARVTHEASIGRVDKKQIETLMARGLEETKAIDLVVSGMFK